MIFSMLQTPLYLRYLLPTAKPIVIGTMINKAVTMGFEKKPAGLDEGVGVVPSVAFTVAGSSLNGGTMDAAGTVGATLSTCIFPFISF